MAFAAFAPPEKNQLSYRDILSWLGPGECGRLEQTDLAIHGREVSDPVVFRDPGGTSWPAAPHADNPFGVIYMTDFSDAAIGTWSVSVGQWQQTLPLPTIPTSVLPAELNVDGTLSASSGFEIRVSPAPAAAYFDIGRWDASGGGAWWDVCRLHEDGTFYVDETLLSGGGGIELFVLETATADFEGRPAALEGAVVYHAYLAP